MLAASRDPLSAHTLKTQVRKLQAKNDRLRERVEKLVKRLEDQQITIEIDTWEQEGHDEEN
jgi:ribosomal protein L9